MSEQIPEQEYAGQRLNLPQKGPGSVASWGRRIGALFIDWLTSVLVANLIAVYSNAGDDLARSLPLAVFFVQVAVFTAVAGGSFGQLALKIAIVRLDGQRVNLLHATVRTFLICLVIPPVIFNRDNRGLHDLAVGTISVLR